MSAKVKALAEKYYPELWNLARLDTLLSAGKLTQAEYEEVTLPEPEGGEE